MLCPTSEPFTTELSWLIKKSRKNNTVNRLDIILCNVLCTKNKLILSLSHGSRVLIILDIHMLVVDIDKGKGGGGNTRVHEMLPTVG